MVGVYAWLVAALIFLIFEMGHPGLFFWLSFSLGSLVAATLSWYDYSWQFTGLVFLLSSLLAIVLLKLTIGRMVKQHSTHTLTNTDALIGKIGFVVAPIAADKPGRVKIGGEEWVARIDQKSILHKGAAHENATREGATHGDAAHEDAAHDRVLHVGARVSVVAVRGSHVVVTLVV